jgi:hypothetical protein
VSGRTRTRRPEERHGLLRRSSAAGAAVLLVVLLLAHVRPAGATDLMPINCTAAGPTAADIALAAQLSPDARLHTDRMSGLDGGQVSCARVIVATVRDDGLDERAAYIAATTAMTESGLHDDTVAVDGTSLGLYQQIDAWGTASQREDPKDSTNLFLGAMQALPGGWETGDIGAICQAVQNSALPAEYGYEVAGAELLVGALWGSAPSGSTGWSAWSMVGAKGVDVSLFAPSAVLTGSGAVEDVFITGKSSGQLWEDSAKPPGAAMKGNFFSALPSGALASTPVALARSSSETDVFARGTDHGVYWTSYTAASGWAAWQRLGTSADTTNFAPGVVHTASGQEEVFITRDTVPAGGQGDRELYAISRPDGSSSWGSFKELTTSANGSLGLLSSGPAVTTPASGELDVFATGGGNRIYESVYRSASGWSTFAAMGRSTDTSSFGPAVVLSKSGNEDVFVTGTNQLLYEMSKPIGGSWSGGFVQKGPSSGAITGAPTVVAFTTTTTPSVNQVDVFALGLDGQTYETQYRSS